MSRKALYLLTALSVAATLTSFEFACAEKGQPIAERKQAYAPWDPADMVARRKEYGLIGPGAKNPVPPPAFPSYLKKPDSIEQLMPAFADCCGRNSRHAPQYDGASRHQARDGRAWRENDRADHLGLARDE